MNNYKYLLKIKEFSEKIHRDQTYGKNGQEIRPYFSGHIKPVVRESQCIASLYNEFIDLFMKYRKPVDETVVKCIAYLHDSVEDQIPQHELDDFLFGMYKEGSNSDNYDYDEFHDFAADISNGVFQLTQIKGDSYYDYVNGIKDPECMIVKLADLNVNITNSDHTFKKRDLYLSVRDMIRIKLFGSIV